MATDDEIISLLYVRLPNQIALQPCIEGVSCPEEPGAAIETNSNNMHGKNTSTTVANVFLIAAMMAAGFDMLWLINSGFGFFAFGIDNNFRDTGVFFGMEGGSMVGRNQDEDGHILVVGGAGTGKSSSIAIPTLAETWTSNFLAIDIKGELAKESGRQACIFNPCDPGAYGYDPFYFVEKQDNPTAALQEIAMTLIPESPGVKEPFWIQSAQSILTGHLIYTSVREPVSMNPSKSCRQLKQGNCSG